jgi:amino acid adenylation domain-containing protein/thioester reductase-like protein
LAERVADLPVAILAVLESGAAYVPIDPEHPFERVELALADADVRLLIALGPTARTFERAQVIPLDELVQLGAVVVVPPSELAPSDAAYVLHTSGSTGKPKGVLVEHASLGSFVHAMERLLPRDAQGPWLAATTLAFDISIVELLCSLALGAEVRVASAPSLKSDQSEPFAVLRALGKGARCFQCTPSLARLMLADSDGRAFFEGLSVLLVGGEALPLWLARALCECVPGAVFNMYGPTETTVWSAAARLHADTAWVPIGEPLANTVLRVVDGQGRDVAKGLSGELLIGGAGVARGYLRREDETAARFTRDATGARFYATGDLVRARELDGGPGGSAPVIALEWLGRMDRQIKLAGNRIELGEIEGVLTEHPFARECAVLTEKLGGEERLVAVVVPDDASMADAGTSSNAVTGIYSADEIESVLLAWAAHKLPQYMLPARTVLVSELPRTASGKTDRQALGALLARRPPQDALRLGERPVTGEEKLLAELWCEVLARADVGRYDDFFALGGTSFSAVLLASRARRRGIALAPAVVLAHPTLAQQALQISAVVVQREARALQEEAKLEPLELSSLIAFWPPRRIVLTGATGFLGAHLLAELHASLDAEIVCLVRAEDDAAARERLRRSVVEWGLGDRVQWNLTRCIAADLKLPRFGLSEGEWRFLSEHSDLVLHNAAEVNFALAYEELRATNVTGTRTAIALAAEGKRKPLHYVSTIAITDASKAGERVDEDSSLAYSERLVDGYSQSKWVAESLVRLAGEQGLDVTCYRAGPLIADRAPKGDAFAEALATVARTGVAFSTRGRSIPHLSRVDDTARAIVMLTLTSKRSSRIEHVVSPQRVAVADLLNWVREWGFEVTELSDDQWLERIDGEHWAAATMFVVSQRLRDGLPLVPEVEHGATLVRLSALGFTWREVDGVLVQRLIARLTGSLERVRPSEAS